MPDIGFPDEMLLKDGKIRVSLTQEYDYEIFVNGSLVKTIHVEGKPEMPDEEHIYQSLRDVGIDPDIV